VLVWSCILIGIQKADFEVEWASGNVYSRAEWSRGVTSDGVGYHKVWKQEQKVFNEHNDQAEWGNFVSISLGGDYQSH